MMSVRVPPARRTAAASLHWRWTHALPLVLLLSCSDQPTAYDGEPQFAPASTALAVTAADPAEGLQGETMQVRVIGSGFARGAVASWERGGAADPKVTVLRTDYVNKTEVLATINIAPDASTERYDIAVTNPDKKKGIGSELFKVQNPGTANVIMGEALAAPGDAVFASANGINDAGTITGLSRAADNVATALVWQMPDLGMVPMPLSGFDMISNTGLVVGGGLYDSYAGWTAVSLPSPFATTFVKDIANNYIVGRTWDQPETLYPIRWEYTNGSAIPLILGDAALIAEGINTLGHVAAWEKKWVKRMQWIAVPLVWTDGGNVVQLPNLSGTTSNLARAISDDGTVVGSAYTSNGSGRLIVWRPLVAGDPTGGYHDPVLIGNVVLHPAVPRLAINAAGQISGNMIANDNTTHGFLYDPGLATVYKLLPPAGSAQTSANALNCRGEVVGRQYDGPAILWRGPVAPGGCD